MVDGGRPCLLGVRRDLAVVEQVRRRFLKVAQSTPRALPEREYARQNLVCAWCPPQAWCREGAGEGR